jgi:hypothetical protein
MGKIREKKEGRIMKLNESKRIKKKSKNYEKKDYISKLIIFIKAVLCPN